MADYKSLGVAARAERQAGSRSGKNFCLTRPEQSPWLGRAGLPIISAGSAGFSALFPYSGCSTLPGMADSASTLRVGDRAPDFILKSANCFDAAGAPQTFSLRQLLAHGPLVLEFLRGTW